MRTSPALLPVSPALGLSPPSRVASGLLNTAVEQEPWTFQDNPRIFNTRAPAVLCLPKVAELFPSRTVRCAEGMNPVSDLSEEDWGESRHPACFLIP